MDGLRQMGATLTIVDHTFDAANASIGLREYRDFIEFEGGELVGEGGTTKTRRLVLPQPGPDAVLFLKTYRYRGSRWRHRFRTDKATCEARNSRTLERRCGVPTPRVVAFGSRRRGLRLLDAFILTRAIPDSIRLDELFARRWPVVRESLDDPDRARLLAQVARTTAAMHDAGFYHVDLQWRNLMISNGPDGLQQVFVIDSPRGGLRRWKPYRQHGRLRDLSCLYKEARRRMSRTECLRWLRRYLGPNGSVTTERLLIQAVLRDRWSKDGSNRIRPDVDGGAVKEGHSNEDRA